MTGGRWRETARSSSARSSVAASWEEARDVWEVNTIGTVNLLDAVRLHRPEARVLVVSTGEVYGRAAEVPTSEESRVAPLSPYAASKAAAEIACFRAREADGLDAVVARSFPHVGPGQDERFAVASWSRQLARLKREGGGTLHVGDLSVRRDLTDVRDVCRAYALMLDRSLPAGTYNVASGDAVPLSRVVDLLIELARFPVAVERDRSRFRPSEISVLAGDASRLRRACGWEPQIPLERTLADVLDDADRTVHEAVPSA